MTHTAAVAAAENVANLCHEVFCDKATAFTCTEAAVMTEFLAHFTGAEAAAEFLCEHAAGDDSGDDHNGMDLAECFVRAKRMVE